MNYDREIFETYMGLGPKRVPHWEHWANPDAETELTGINYYEHPRECRLRMAELYPELRLAIPETDAPIVRDTSNHTSDHTVRWGDSQTATCLHGEQFFKTEEDVFHFSPLEHADMREWKFVVENYDYSSEEAFEACLRQRNPKVFEDKGPYSIDSPSFYNTMFMWPLLTFGWERFLDCCLEPEFERIMDEFAELNRRAFRVFAKLPVKFFICHDDIMMTNGPVCSPEWMHKYIFPRYEEFFGMLKDSGKEIIYMVDGCADAYVDELFALGVRGIISEPYTDYKAIARKHKDAFLAGEGDNRILLRNDPAEIRAMVERMAETTRMSGGYMMCIGNHIPWNVPAEAIKRYLEYSRELVYR